MLRTTTAPLAALLLASALARPSILAAQPRGDERAFTGCDLYVCALVDVTEQYDGPDAYLVGIRGTLTLQPAVVSGAFDAISFGELGTNAFGGDLEDCVDAGGLEPPVIRLTAAAAGDAVAIGAPGCLRRGFVPITSASFDAALLTGPFLTYTGLRVDPVLTAVPEPSTVALTLGGLAALGAATWRRRRS